MVKNSDSNKELSAKKLNSLKNLKPFKKGERRKPGPGRPPMKAIREAVLEDWQKNGNAVIQNIRKKYPALYLGYGFGKPAETVLLGNVEGQTLRLETSSADEIKRKLIESGALDIEGKLIENTTV